MGLRPIHVFGPIFLIVLLGVGAVLLTHWLGDSLCMVGCG